MKLLATKFNVHTFLLLFFAAVFPVVLYPSISSAKTINADSLKNLLISVSQDSVRLRLLFETGYAEFYQYRYDSAAAYYLRTIELAQKTGAKETVAKTNYFLGEMYLETGDFDKALQHYSKAVDFYSKENNRKELNNVWFGLGLAYKSKGYYDAALTYYNLSLEISEDLMDTLSVADTYNNMATAEKNLGKYPEAMEHLLAALEIYRKYNKPVYIFNVLNNIGSVHEKQGSMDKALDYYEQSLALAHETGDKYYLLAPLTNTASMYATTGNFEKALELFKEALQLAKDINDNVRIADYYLELGKLMQKNNRLKEALGNYRQALEIADKTGNSPAKISALLGLSELSADSKNYLETEKYATQALTLSNQINALPEISEAYRLLYIASGKTGKYESALEFQRYWITIKDSIFSIAKTRAIEELEIKHQVKAQIEENERLKSEAASLQEILDQRKRVSILLSIGLILLAGVILLLIKQVKNHKKLQLQEEAIHRQKTDNLKEKIEFQKRELVSKSMYITEKNTSLERIIEQLEEISIRPNDDTTKQIRLKEIIRELKFELRNQNHWEEFETHFNAVHPGFYKNLNERYPELTVNDRKLSAFLKLKLSTKNISSITGQSIKSIEVARSRLRKKMNLTSEDNFLDVLERI